MGNVVFGIEYICFQNTSQVLKIADLTCWMWLFRLHPPPPPTPSHNAALKHSHPQMPLTAHSVSWEPEGRYHYSKMFRWEPEWHFHHRLCTANRALLVLSGTSLKIDSALLTLNWWLVAWCEKGQELQLLCILCEGTVNRRMTAENQKGVIAVQSLWWKCPSGSQRNISGPLPFES